MFPLAPSVSVLFWTIQDVQRRLHGPQQLSSALSPHGPLLRVPAQPRLQLVHPKGQKTLSVKRQRCWTWGPVFSAVPRGSPVSRSPLQGEGVVGDHFVFAGQLYACVHLSVVQLRAEELLEGRG